MSKFLRFCITFLGFDLLVDWVKDAHRKDKFLNFFNSLVNLLMWLVGLHFLGFIVVGLLEPKFFTDYGQFITNIPKTPTHEIFLAFMLLVAVAIMAIMLIVTALFICAFLIIGLIAIPWSLWKWGRKKWCEIYECKCSESDEDDEEDNEDDD